MTNRSFLAVVLVVLVVTTKWSSIEARPRMGIYPTVQGRTFIDELATSDSPLPEEGKFNPHLLAKLMVRIPWAELTHAMTAELWDVIGEMLDEFSWVDGVDALATLHKGKIYEPHLLAETLEKIPWSKLIHAITPELGDIIGKILDDTPWEEELDEISKFTGGKLFNPHLLAKILGHIPWSELIHAMTEELWDVIGEILDDFSWVDGVDALASLHEGKKYDPHLLAETLEKIPWHKLLHAITPELWDIIGKILDALPWEEVMEALSELTGGKLFNPHLLAGIFNSIPWRELAHAITPELMDVIGGILDNDKISWLESIQMFSNIHSGKAIDQLALAEGLDKIPWSDLISAITPELWAIIGRILDDLPRAEIVKSLQAQENGI